MAKIKAFSYDSALGDLILINKFGSKSGGVDLFIASSHSTKEDEAIEKAVELSTARGGTPFILLELRKVERADLNNGLEALLRVPSLETLPILAFSLPAQEDSLLSLISALNLNEVHSELVAAGNEVIQKLVKVIKDRVGLSSQQRQKPAVMLHTVFQSGSSAANTIRLAVNAEIEEKRQRLAARLEEQGPTGPAPEDPLVSICLPVQNAEKSIAKTLEGILCQTFENFEVLIADDHSDDNTLEIVTYYASRDARIIPWINEEPVGAVKNHNECLMRARGKYIKPLSQDSWLHPQHLEQMLEIAESQPQTALILAATDESLPDWSEIGLNSSNQTLKAIVEHGLDDLRRLAPCPSALFFRSAHIGKGFNSNLPNLATVDYALRILTKGDLFLFPCGLLETTTWHNNQKQWAGYYMELAAESIQIAASSQEILKNIGIEKEVFVDSSLLKLGNDLTHTEATRGRIALNAPGGKLTSNQNTLPVAVTLLRTLGRCQQRGGSADSRAREIELLEERVRELLSSPSWRMTKVLRDWNARLQNDTAIASSIDWEKIDWTENLAQQTYAELLRKIIREIKTSRSWRLTAPLRRWKGKRNLRSERLEK
ncbi:MAG: glycosyltransferase family 2 protein [Candidatus Obscuribacterales bacterium]|nr:glycosyltransferase family 2 protein [Candidatus Obscuribacterales bacterium]